MTARDPFAPGEIKFRRDFLIASSLLAAILGAILIANPGIDIAISQAAREACVVPPARPGGPWCPTAVMELTRRVFMVIFVLAAIVAIAAAVRFVVAERRWIGSRQVRCWFLVAAIVAGPGLVANLVLKDNMGRARPRDVVEFGGTKAFTPPLVVSRECARNCSFVSGEASSMFVVFFALTLLFPLHRRVLLASGIAIGLFAGAVRIMQGAHFFSDVLFAGVFMALTASLLHIALIGVWRDPQRTREMLQSPFTPLMRFAQSGRVR